VFSGPKNKEHAGVHSFRVHYSAPALDCRQYPLPVIARSEPREATVNSVCARDGKKKAAVMTSQVVPEPIIDPDLPIVDAHHHLWFLPETSLAAMEKQDSASARALVSNFRRHARYLFDEFMTDLDSGHNVRASVFVDAYAMYRSGGPEVMKSVGEVEFANGIAAMSASGIFGEAKVCAGIVGGIDLRLGRAVEDILVAHIRAGGTRYRGVRCSALYDDDSSILGVGAGVPGLLLDPKFRVGFKYLHSLGLSFDALVLEPQLPDLIDLSRAFPETQIILNHVGVPTGVGRYAGHREERFSIWRKHIKSLSQSGNVAVKLGGLGLPFGGFRSYIRSPCATSSELASEWAPYIETCIEAFGAQRCMFESNFPVDSAACSYPVLWNAFKRIASGASGEEKTALFSGTATRVYRLENAPEVEVPR
jgi:L-fuconolactonase